MSIAASLVEQDARVKFGDSLEIMKQLFLQVQPSLGCSRSYYGFEPSSKK